MTFSEVENRYVILKNKLKKKRITPQNFNSLVDQLRIQDEQGRWWQKRAADGQWIFWDGTAWVKASPPMHNIPIKPQNVVGDASGSSQNPQTLGQLLKMVLKGMSKGLFKKAFLAIGLALLTLVLHTYLLVGPNGGFDPGTNATLDSILALRGRMVSGTLFWTLLGGLLSIILSRLRRAGIKGTLRNIQATPAWVMNAFKTEGQLAFGILLAGVALSLIIGARLGNRLVSLQFATASIGALIAQHESLSYMLMAATWGDTNRLLKRPPKPFNPSWASAGITGAALGFGWLTLIPTGTFLGCAGGLVLLGIAIAMVLMQKNKSGLGIAILLLATIISLTLTTTPVYADDGGWDEAGGSASEWVGSEGATQAVSHGIPPSVGAAVGALVGSSLVGAAGIASGGGSPVPIPTPKPQVPATPIMPPTTPPVSADNQWEQKWINNGWVWSDADDGFIPQPGARDENGWRYDNDSGDFIPPAGTFNDKDQVWSSIPGQGWVTPEEHEWQQDNLEDGLVWDDHWGFQEPGVAQNLTDQRDEQWKNFIDPTKSQQQIEQDIANGLLNDPDRLKSDAEFQAIQDMIDQAKKDLLSGAIKTHQGDADYYIMQDKILKVVSMPIKVVKVGADVTIDILGEIPGAPQKIKYIYKFASKWAESGSISDGVVNAGKEIVGDYLGGKIPTQKFTPDVAKFVKYIPGMKKSTHYSMLTKVLVLNNLKSQAMGQGVNNAWNVIANKRDEILFDTEGGREFGFSNPYAQSGVDD